MAALAEVKADKKWKWVEAPEFNYLQDKTVIYEWIGALLEYKSPFDQYMLTTATKPTEEETRSWITKTHAYIDLLTPPVVERFTFDLVTDF